MSGSSPWTALASGITSGATFVVRIAEFAYALHSVDKQTQQYLLVANHAGENIKTAERLLRERREYLPHFDRLDYERVVDECKSALIDVQKLLEPARVDRKADKKIRLTTRANWVLKDHPDIEAALHRLNLVHNTLNQNNGSLRQVRSREDSSPPQLSPPRDSKAELPSYDESMRWRRQSLARRGRVPSPNPGLGLHSVEGQELGQGIASFVSVENLCELGVPSPNSGLGLHNIEGQEPGQGVASFVGVENLCELDGGLVHIVSSPFSDNASQADQSPPQSPPSLPTKTVLDRPVPGATRRHRSWLSYHADLDS